MTNAEKITDYLKNNQGQYCDDCLSKLLKIEPRQSVNAECRFLNQRGKLQRFRDVCSWCTHVKLVNSLDNAEIKEPVAPTVKTSTSRPNIDGGRLSYNQFEERVSDYFQKQFQDSFVEKALVVGENRTHKFDLVSNNNSIIVECKSYTWTKDNNFPSAKISTAVEAAFYLSRIKAQRKVIVFQDDFNNKGESLVEVFVRRYDGLLDDIEIWSYIVGGTPDKDQIITMRNAKDSWYEKLYS